MVAYGPNARAFNIFDKNVVQAELDRLLGPGLTVEDIFGWDWVHDPFAQVCQNTVLCTKTFVNFAKVCGRSIQLMCSQNDLRKRRRRIYYENTSTELYASPLIC
jgi:hypothetical protein